MTTLEFTRNLLGLQTGYSGLAMNLTTGSESMTEYTDATCTGIMNFKDKIVDFKNLSLWSYKVMNNTLIENYRSNFQEDSGLSHTLNRTNAKRLMGRRFFSEGSDFDPDEIEKTLDSLTKEFRVPFSMYLNGLKYKEIAQLMGVTTATVKCRIFFARKKLLLILKDNLR